MGAWGALKLAVFPCSFVIELLFPPDELLKPRITAQIVVKRIVK